MSFLAKLELDGETFNVLEFDVDFEQKIDHNHKPSGNSNGGILRITLESSMTDTFSDWMVSNSMTKDGKVTFFKRDAMSRMKNVTFKNAYCIRYNESFRADGSYPMITRITLTSQAINVGNTAFKNKWTVF